MKIPNNLPIADFCWYPKESHLAGATQGAAKAEHFQCHTGYKDGVVHFSMYHTHGVYVSRRSNWGVSYF